MTTPLTESAVRELANQWYHGLDTHVKEVELLPLLVSDGLTQLWPDFTVRNLCDFEDWYQRALRLFFDEVHTIKEFTVTPKGNGTEADVSVFVNWKARTWNPGDAESKFLNLDIRQSWEVVVGPAGKPVIKTIKVDSVEPQEGSSAL